LVFGGVVAFTISPLNQTTRHWSDVCVAPDEDVYACAAGGFDQGGGYYKQTAGIGDFEAIQLTELVAANSCLAAKSNGDIFSTIGFYDVLKQTGGEGNFNRIFTGAIAWTGITGVQNGDVYAASPGTGANGDIYRFANGAAPKIALSQTKRGYGGMSANADDDIYVVVNGGDIYKKPAAENDFVSLGQTTRLWWDVQCLPNGDVIATTQTEGIFRQKAGTGDFESIYYDPEMIDLYGLGCTSDGDIYVCSFGGDIYMLYNEILIMDFIGVPRFGKSALDVSFSPIETYVAE
jgi:hypothetical protein